MWQHLLFNHASGEHVTKKKCAHLEILLFCSAFFPSPLVHSVVLAWKGIWPILCFGIPIKYTYGIKGNFPSLIRYIAYSRCVIYLQLSLVNAMWAKKILFFLTDNLTFACWSTIHKEKVPFPNFFCSFVFLLPSSSMMVLTYRSLKPRKFMPSFLWHHWHIFAMEFASF